MAQQRLTNYMRREILNRAIEYAFKEREAELDAQEGKLALRVLNDQVPGEHHETMTLLPDKYFPEASSI